jgi:membrane-bound metal-dependent hydrolase YbcI (DUF457 family)
MVMAPTHALQSATGGLAAAVAAQHLGMPMTIPLALVCAGLGAGAGVAPDIDHGSATITRSLGPITGAASRVVQKISAGIYAATKTDNDRSNKNGHRGITHTVPGALAAGALFGGIPALAGRYSPTAGIVASLAVIWFCLVLALRALPPMHSHLRDYATAVGLTGAAWWVLANDYTGYVPLLLGVVVAIGCLVHALGDGITDSGVPLAWPLVIGRQRWYPCGPPKPLRFKAGQKVEKWVARPASIVALIAVALLLVPGAYPLLWHAAQITLPALRG